jgi:hypothetical protein
MTILSLFPMQAAAECRRPFWWVNSARRACVQWSRELAGYGTRAPSPHQLAQASLYGYTVAFWWMAGIVAAGAVICGALMRWGPAARPV